MVIFAFTALEMFNGIQERSNTAEQTSWEKGTFEFVIERTLLHAPPYSDWSATLTILEMSK